MDITKMAEENKILRMKSGSQLYGTSTPASDTDYVGIFVASEDYYFGLLNVNESDNSVSSKNELGKNNMDAIDDKYYELRNFARLALQNNPNIIEMVFCNEDNLIYIDEFGKLIIDNKHLFPYKGAYDRFIGYAVSQKKKMIIREEHYTDLVAARDFFLNDSPEKYILEYRDVTLPFKFEELDAYFRIGDLSFQKHIQVKKIVEMLHNRISKISNRYELVLKHGYDTKFSMHLIRLLLEGKELLETGAIQFPLKDREFLLDIKHGKYSLTEILSFSEQFENEMRCIKEKSSLPSKPNFDEVNKLIKYISRESLINGR